MRLNDLTGCRVVDGAGREIGQVRDVRLVEWKDVAAVRDSVVTLRL